MHPLLLRTRARLRDAGKSLGGAAVGALTIAMLRTTRYFDPVKTAQSFRPRHPLRSARCCASSASAAPT